MYFGMLTRNAVLDCALLAWFICQAAKVMIDAVVLREFSLHRMITSGGMPSSHSGFVVAATAAIGKLYGIDGPLFALAAIFSAVVMYDACNVRRCAGDTAHLVNLLLSNLEKRSHEGLSKDLKEVMGHSPFQVFVGALIGLALGLLV